MTSPFCPIGIQMSGFHLLRAFRKAVYDQYLLVIKRPNISKTVDYNVIHCPTVSTLCPSPKYLVKILK